MWIEEIFRIRVDSSRDLLVYIWPYDNEYVVEFFLILEWVYVYMTICGFKREMLNWIIVQSEKRCILGIYFVSHILY